MGVKEILRKWAEKNTEKKGRFKELEEEYLMNKKLEEKQKSANERELERYMEEAREKRIKVNLEKFRKQQKKEFWSSNMMNNKQTSILKEDKPILKEKNIFKMKGNMFMKGNMLNSKGFK